MLKRHNAVPWHLMRGYGIRSTRASAKRSRLNHYGPIVRCLLDADECDFD